VIETVSMGLTMAHVFLSGDEEQRPQATCGFWMVSFFVLQA
jgi:hypothetical protein